MATNVDVLKAGQFGQVVSKKNAKRLIGSIKTGGAFSAYAAADRTIASTFLVKTRPIRARLRLFNSTNAAITGVAAAIAPSANQTTWYLPSGGLSAFKAVTIDSTIPAATIGSGDNVVPVSIQSDWFAVNAVPRDDGGEGFILMLRVYQNSVGCKMQVGGSAATADFARYECRIGHAASAGNFLSTSVVFNEGGFNGPAFVLDLEFETPTATVAFVGDSIMAGANADPAPTGSSAFGAAFQAMKDLRASGYQIQSYNAGWSGASTIGLATSMPDLIQGYLGQFISHVNGGSKPSAAAFCPWSVNNTGATNAYSATAIDLAKQAASVFVSFCQQNDIIPMLVTPAPVNGISSTFESSRRQIVSNIKNFASITGVIVIDRDGVYTDYSKLEGGFKFTEWCVDGTHPTQVGHAAEKSAWIESLRFIL